MNISADARAIQVPAQPAALLKSILDANRANLDAALARHAPRLELKKVFDFYNAHISHTDMPCLMIDAGETEEQPIAMPLLYERSYSLALTGFVSHEDPPQRAKAAEALAATAQAILNIQTCPIETDDGRQLYWDGALCPAIRYSDWVVGQTIVTRFICDIVIKEEFQYGRP